MYGLLQAALPAWVALQISHTPSQISVHVVDGVQRVISSQLCIHVFRAKQEHSLLIITLFAPPVQLENILRGPAVQLPVAQTVGQGTTLRYWRHALHQMMKGVVESVPSVLQERTLRITLECAAFAVK